MPLRDSINKNDEVIACLCKEGDLSNFSQLYESYLDGIFRFVFVHVGNRKETAEDITSSVFIKAMDNVSSFNPDLGSFKSWIYRIARNSVIDHYRTSKKTIDLEEMGDISSTENIEEDVERRTSLKKVKEALNNLSDEQKEIVILRVWEDMSFKEISNIIKKNEATVKMSFYRAMDKIKDLTIILPLVILKLLNINI